MVGKPARTLLITVNGDPIKDDSMIDAGIRRGDRVIVESAWLPCPVASSTTNSR